MGEKKGREGRVIARRQKWAGIFWLECGPRARRKMDSSRILLPKEKGVGLFDSERVRSGRS